MAQFEPKKLNIGEINGGNRFNNGDGVSAEAINAPIEAALYAEEIAKEAIGVKEQVQDHEERIAQTEYDTKMLYAIASQKGLYAVAEVEQAYTSRVTANGENIVDEQKTPVTMIKGSTVRCENLIPYPFSNRDGVLSNPSIVNGVTFTFNDDGTITANGTSTNDVWFLISSYIPVAQNTNYFLSGCPAGGSNSTYRLHFNARTADNVEVYPKSYNDTGSGVVCNVGTEATKCLIYIRVSNGVTLNNVVFKPYLKVGTEGQWQPYFTDLKHAKIDSIVSTSGNLFNPALLDDYVAREGNWFYFNVNPTTVPQITLFDEPKNIYTKVKYKQLDENSNSRGVVFQFVKSDGSITEMSTYLNKDGENALYIENVVGVKFSYGSQSINTLGDFIISTVDIPYTPYNKAIYQLPETLELPKWDRFNPQTGEITRGTGKITFTSKEEWNIENNVYGGKTFYTNVIENAIPRQSVICNYYISDVETSTGLADNAFISSTKRLNITALNFTTLDEWKAYLADLYERGTPLIVEYKLATPTVEKLENAPKSYTAYNQGNETAVLENEEFGAIPTITNEYIVVL